ncbi:Hypp8031 [Branchiostoma lanceolatum]|uniref:Hypp8031 protein n=1 Tax=Branchiostoma lanceolatum TaxID=7740 RepID=A0A8K0EGB7_BRALA|nr:Hypp8031 [Branchiostoma lanceolatum]
MQNSDVHAGDCYVDRICVDEEYRGKGIGKAMLDRAESVAREHGCTMMSLLVTQTNRAVGLYEREGYNIVTNRWSLCTWCMMGNAAFFRMEKQL